MAVDWGGMFRALPDAADAGLGAYFGLKREEEQRNRQAQIDAERAKDRAREIEEQQRGYADTKRVAQEWLQQHPDSGMDLQSVIASFSKGIRPDSLMPEVKEEKPSMVLPSSFRTAIANKDWATADRIIEETAASNPQLAAEMSALNFRASTAREPVVGSGGAPSNADLRFDAQTKVTNLMARFVHGKLETYAGNYDEWESAKTLGQRPLVEDTFNPEAFRAAFEQAMSRAKDPEVFRAEFFQQLQQAPPPHQFRVMQALDGGGAPAPAPAPAPESPVIGGTRALELIDYLRARDNPPPENALAPSSAPIPRGYSGGGTHSLEGLLIPRSTRTPTTPSIYRHNR